MAVVAPRAAGTGETVKRRGAVRTVIASVTVGAIPETAGITVSGAANVTYDAVGPAIAVNPGVCRRCVTRGAAATGVAVSPAPRLSRGRSGRRNRKARAKNRHRRVFSTVPHDLVSWGNCSRSAGLRDRAGCVPSRPQRRIAAARSCFARNRTLGRKRPRRLRAPGAGKPDSGGGYPLARARRTGGPPGEAAVAFLEARFQTCGIPRPPKEAVGAGVARAGPQWPTRAGH